MYIICIYIGSVPICARIAGVYVLCVTSYEGEHDIDMRCGLKLHRNMPTCLNVKFVANA